MAVEFSYQHYIASHGASPSGEGSWGFSTNPDPSRDGRSDDIIWVRATFVEAKRKARHAVKLRFGSQPVVLYVLP